MSSIPQTDGVHPQDSPPTFRLVLEATRRAKSTVLVQVPGAEGAGETVHRDQVVLDQDADRRRYARAAAPKIPGAVDSTPAEIEGQLLQLANQVAVGGDDAPPPGPGDGAAPTAAELGAARLAETPEDIVAEAEELSRDPNLLDRFGQDIARIGVAGEQTLALLILLVGVSRLLLKPLAAVVQGTSSSGKSFVISLVVKLFPPEAVIRATAITPNALFYMTPGSLSHRFVVAGERSRSEGDDAAEATRALREMISGGELTKLVTGKDADGNLTTQQIRQPGPIAFVESTTLENIFAEDANRCLMLQTDERAEQTRAVLGAAAAGLSGRARADTERIIAVHHALQRAIPNTDVVIPFAVRVAELFNFDRVETRRTFNHLMGLVKAVTLLHHNQRERDGEGRIVARREDYEAAFELAGDALGRASGELPAHVARFWDRLQERIAGVPEWNSNVAMRDEKVSRATVYRYLDALADAGFIEQVVPKKGKVPAVWKAAPRPNGSGGRFGKIRVDPIAPTPDAVFGTAGAAESQAA